MARKPRGDLASSQNEGLVGADDVMRDVIGPVLNEDMQPVEEADDGDDEEELDLDAVLKAEYDDAADFIDSVIAPLREEATRYYRGEPFGDEEEGRSQIVLTVTRDTINAIMPSLMRVFVGGEQVVEFAPATEADVAQAEQATDYVNYLLDADGNNRYTLLFNAFKDALTRKVGFVTCAWETAEDVSERTYSGLSIGQAQILKTDPEVEVLEESVSAGGDPRVEAALRDPNIDPQTKLEFAAMLDVTVDMRVRRRRTKGRLRVESVPPEEIVISRNAKDEDSATLVARRRFIKASDAIAMGIPEDIVEENVGRDNQFGTNSEALIRQLNPDYRTSASPDESQADILLIEGWLRVDTDDDGISELRFFRAVGDNCRIVDHEIEPSVRLALFCPNPEPHSVWGSSTADETMDLQNIQSHIMRNTLDSLASAIFPALAVVENAVELNDCMNTEIGRVIRMKAPGMVQPLSEPFLGQQALGIMEYIDEIRASRTGMSKASQGLDPDVLQSTTAAAVTATLSSAQERLEIIARTFAETGMKKLFKGILQTITRHQDKPRMIRLRGDWVEVDPREWNSDMDVHVQVALGRGDDAERMAFLGAMSQKQEAILQMLGPENPLVGLDQLRNTYAEMCRLAGYKDAARFFKPINAAMAQRMAQAGKPQSDPAQLLAQVEVEKTKADIAIANQKATVDAWKAKQEDDRERDKLEAEIRLKAAELNMKYGAQVNMAQIQAQIDRDRNAMEVASNERAALHRNEMQAHAQINKPQPQTTGATDGTA